MCYSGPTHCILRTCPLILSGHSEIVTVRKRNAQIATEAWATNVKSMKGKQANEIVDGVLNVPANRLAPGHSDGLKAYPEVMARFHHPVTLQMQRQLRHGMDDK